MIHKNWQRLLNLEIGDNLLRKYIAKLVSSSLNEVFDCSTNLISIIVPQKHEYKKEIKNILKSTSLWIKNLYIFDSIFNWDKEKNNETVINLDYDIPRWFSNKNKNILNFKKKINYKMELNEINLNVKNELIALHGDKDKIFVIGKYFHTRVLLDNEIIKSSVEI